MTSSTSMLDVLRVIRPHVAGDLVSEERFDQIDSLAERLAPLDWGGFECPLGSDCAPADLHLGLSDRHDALLLAGSGINEDMEASHDGWRRIRELCRQWGERSIPALDPVDRIGLEFDVPSEGEAVLPPSVFWSFGHPEADLIDRDIQLEAIHSAVMTLLDGDGIDLIDAGLAGIMRHSPRGTTILHAGVMLARPGSPLRVNIWGLEFTAIPAFLEHLGKTPRMGELIPLVERLSGLSNSIVVGIDIGPNATNRVGLECAAARKEDGTLDWRALLEAVEDLGLCTTPQREALLSWPGHDDPVSSPVPWPGNLIVRSLHQPPERMSTFTRSISHVKVALSEEGAPEAKAYLEYRHSWLDLE